VIALLAGDGDRFLGIAALLIAVGLTFVMVKYGRHIYLSVGKVRAELSPNGGSSLKDQLNRVEQGMSTLHDGQRDIRANAERWQGEMLGRFNEMDSRVRRLERAHHDRQEAS